MSDKWRVNDGTQVDVGGKLYVGGDTFTATDEEVDEFGSRPYVTKLKAEAKASPVADTKAQTSSPNKAQTASSNKSSK